MNRQQVKELLPIIQAYAEGKQIEIKTKEGKSWSTLEEDDIQYLDFKKCDFRIKPEPKYRPFKDAQECLEEMKKHIPFGWLKDKNKDSELRNIQALTEEMSTMTDRIYLRGIRLIDGWHVFEEAIEEYTFADGTPFGILEED